MALATLVATSVIVTAHAQAQAQNQTRTKAQNQNNALAAQPQSLAIKPVAPEALRKARKERNPKHRSVKQVLGTVDPDIQLSTTQGPDLARLALRYRYDVAPAYQSGLYTRLDRWQASVAIRDLIPGLKLMPGTEIVAIRQYKSKKDALKAAPKLKLNSLPLSAENARAMETGSILMFSVAAEDFKGVDGSVNVAGPLAVGGKLGHADRGLFQVQAQKLNGNKVRLRLVATRQHAFEAEGAVRLKVGPVRTNLATAGASKGPQSLVSAEYEFDLDKPEAIQAYNSIFAKGGLRPSLRLANPFMTTSETSREMNAHLGDVQKLAATDASESKDARRVSRSYESVSTSNPIRSRKGFNLLEIASFQKSTSVTSRSHLTYVDEAGIRHETPSTNYESRKQTRRLFGLRNEQEIRRASYISKTDSRGELTGGGEYVVTLELKDKRMGKSETEKARVKLRRLIAPSILNKLRIDPLLTQTAYKNARVYTQVVFTEKAFQWLRGLSADQITTSLTNYLTERKESTADHARSIRASSDLLAKILDPMTTPEARLDIFGKLQKESLFRDAGSGYLMSLLPESQLEELVSVFIRVDATAFDKPVLATFGHSDFRQIEKATECADYQQNRTSIDLRLEDVCATATDTTTGTSALPATSTAQPAEGSLNIQAQPAVSAFTPSPASASAAR